MCVSFVSMSLCVCMSSVLGVSLCKCLLPFVCFKFPLVGILQYLACFRVGVCVFPADSVCLWVYLVVSVYV